MKTLSLLTVLFLSQVIPEAHAAVSVTLQPLILPVLSEPMMVDAELPVAARQADIGIMVINGTNAAVATEIRKERVELIREARFVSVPVAAETVPKTTVESIRDGSISTVFQPTTAGSHAFLLSFEREVTPDQLTIQVSSGRIKHLRVRVGQSQSTLEDAFVGDASSLSIPLSGVRARMVEITMDVEQGILKIGEIQLAETKAEFSFRAIPKNSYSLMYGANLKAPNLRNDPILPTSGKVTAMLGKATTMQVTDDFDGIGAEKDNCPLIWNRDQEDRDGDTYGDACDNCPSLFNPAQEDDDKDGIGNLCDDDDNDGIINSVDNCPSEKNPLQEDEDKDGIGNICDTDDSRFSADKPWLLWVAIAGVIGGLGIVSAFIFRGTKAT